MNANLAGGQIGLKELIEGRVKETKERALHSISALQAIAQELRMKEVATRLGETHKNLAEDTFKIILVGRFKNGKSTLLNALLGKPTHPVDGLPLDQGPMKSHRLPCTATLTRVVYSDTPYVNKWDVNGTHEKWSFQRYLSDSSVKASEEETERFFDQIREFEVGFPAELCRSGITMLDSPGTSDMPKRTAYTINAVRKSDAAIVVFSDAALAGQDEREFVERDVIGSGATQVFYVVNLWEPLDEELKRFSWHRLVKEKAKGDYQESDFQKYNVFFVNARTALRSKLKDDKAGMIDSGLLALEARLGEFLATDRHLTHMERFVEQAKVFGTSITEQVRHRLDALKMDQDRLREALRNTEPRIEAIRVRRGKLQNIFNRYRRLMKSEGRMSFENALRRIRLELPKDLKETKLKSLDGIGNITAAFNSKPAATEAIKHVEEFASGKIKAWAEDGTDPLGLQRSIMPHLKEMLNEVHTEVAEIATEIKRINYAIAASSLILDSKVTVVTVVERVLCGAAGLFIGDFSSIFGAAGGGWASVAGNLAGQLGGFAVLFGLSSLGFAVSPIAIPVMAVVGLVGSMAGAATVIEGRIKDSVVKKVDEKLAKLPEEKLKEVENGLDTEMARIEAEIMKEVDSAIREEEQKLRMLVRDNEQSQEEKATLGKELQRNEGRIGVQLVGLNESLNVAKQVVG